MKAIAILICLGFALLAASSAKAACGGNSLSTKAREIFKEAPLPRDPSPDEICEVVERIGVWFDKRGRMIVLSERG